MPKFDPQDKPVMVDGPDMSGDDHNKVPTVHLVLQSDQILQTAINNKSSVKYWENGVFQNGNPVTGDVIVFTDSTTTSGGSATFYPTDDHTSTGTALCSYLSGDSFQPNYRDSSAVYAPGTVTVAANKKSIGQVFTKLVFTGIVLLSTNILGSEAQNAIPDGVTVKASWWGVSK